MRGVCTENIINSYFLRALRMTVDRRCELVVEVTDRVLAKIWVTRNRDTEVSFVKQDVK